MATQVTLSAEPREQIRKGANRKLRATGRVPAILYGKDAEPMLLSVNAREAERLFQQISVENTIIELKVTGDKSKIQALVREVQVAALRPDLLHIDFYKIQAGVKLEVEVPVHLIGIPNGVRNDGGMLEQLIHDIAVRCLPEHIPQAIDLDVTSMALNSSLHVSDLQAPEGVEFMVEADRTLCIVSVPRAVVEAAPGEAAQTEVIGADKADADGEKGGEGGDKKGKDQK